MPRNKLRNHSFVGSLNGAELAKLQRLSPSKRLSMAIELSEFCMHLNSAMRKALTRQR